MEYHDIYLEPNLNRVRSRSEIDVSCNFLGRKFSLPVIPANMPCVINNTIAQKCLSLNIPYVLSRYLPAFAGRQSVLSLIETPEYAANPFLSISVGLKTDLSHYRDLPINWFTIDVAHGASRAVVEKAQLIKSLFPKSKVIVGNIGSYEGAAFLANNKEIDAIKVGIARGGACSTYGKTGFATPMVSLIHGLVRIEKPIIIDGGIKCNGDLAKAFAVYFSYGEYNGYGYSDKMPLVMAGSLFAACSDSPAELSLDGTKKIYYGNASYNNKILNAENKTNIEGQIISIDCNNMTFEEKISEIKQDLQSSVSYAGGKEIRDFRWVNVKSW